MTKGNRGHHKHESYAEKEAHKLESLYKDQKPWTDELNKIRKERPGEFNKIFQTMNHHANVDKTLPNVSFFQENREAKITVESSSKERNPSMQRADRYRQDSHTGKWQPEDNTIRQVQKIMESTVASAADSVGGMMKPAADFLQWSNPGAKGIQAIINEAADIAKQKSQQ